MSGNVEAAPTGQDSQGEEHQAPDSWPPNENKYYACPTTQSYYWAYYSSYCAWYYQPVQCPAHRTHFAYVSGKGRILALLSLWSTITLTFCWTMTRWCSGSGHATWRGIQGWVHKIKIDGKRLVRVAKFALSEILMVMMHYCPLLCLRRRFRRWALAMRPFVVQTPDDNEEVGPISPGSTRTPRSTARQSLAAIQLEVAGGTAHPARRTLRQRYPAHRRMCVVVKYNPQTPGECMFAAIARAVKLKYGSSMSTRSLRSIAHDLLVKADPDSVRRCADQCGYDIKDFVEKVKMGRWGTSLDFKLLATELDLPCILLNRETGCILHEHQCDVRPQDKILVVYDKYHFTVASQPRWFVKNKQSRKLPGRCRRNTSKQWVAGGGPKRPFPLAAAGDMQRIREEQAEAPVEVIMTYHGSFAPMHVGHRECLASAIQHLKHYHVVVRRVIMGFTSMDQASWKTTDSAFSSVKTRVAIARQVLQDGEGTDPLVEVDEAEHSTSMSLAMKYAQAGVTSLYLVGSDIMKKPSLETLIVTRSILERTKCGAEFYDRNTHRGVCWQKKLLNVTSTKVRSALADYRMPAFYSKPAQHLIRRALGWIKAVKRDRAAADGPLEGASSSVCPTPVAACSIEEREEPEEVRPPLKRRRQRDEHVPLTRTEAPLRPPLPRRRVATGVTLEPAPVNQQPELDDLNLPNAPEAFRLACDGTMKLQPPFLSNLGRYWMETVIPLCKLLSVTPVSLCRRGTYGQLRVAYYSGDDNALPLVRFVATTEVVELYRNIRQMGEVHLHCAYLAFDLTHIGLVDIDPDTERGIMVRATLQAAIEHIAGHTMLSMVKVAFFMFQAAHLVVLSRPTYRAHAIVLAEEVQEIADNFLSRFEDTTQEEMRIRLLINQEKTTYVMGGMRRGATGPPIRYGPDQPFLGRVGTIGTEPPQAGAPLYRPFQQQGEDVFDETITHHFQNRHDLADMTARHFQHQSNKADWHCPPPLDVPPVTEGCFSLVTTTGCHTSSDSSYSSSSEVTPRAARVSRLRWTLRNMGVVAHVPDCSCDVSATLHAWNRQQDLVFLDEEEDEDTAARLRLLLFDTGDHKELVEQAALRVVQTNEEQEQHYTDFEADYDDYEEEIADAARDRRICLLSQRLHSLDLGQPVNNDVPEYGTDERDMSEVVLVNPNELAQLCRLHLLDLERRPPRSMYMRRDVTWHLPSKERWHEDNNIDQLRFNLIAYKPHLLTWQRVCRSPLTQDDLHPQQAQCIVQGHQTLLAWGNPHRVQVIEREFVADWQRERLRRLMQRAQEAIDGAPVRRGLPLVQSSTRVEDLSHLRAYLRANAAPLEPYVERLQADLLGDDLYETGGGARCIECEDIVQGGMLSSCAHIISHGFDAVRYPDCDPCTGHRNDRSAPSWTRWLNLDQCAHRKTQLVLYLLLQLDIVTTNWSTFLLACEDTADAIFNARFFYRTCQYRGCARLTWMGILERELGPTSSPSRSSFLHWLKAREACCWVLSRTEVANNRCWREFLVGRYIALYSSTIPFQRSFRDERRSARQCDSTASILVTGGGGKRPRTSEPHEVSHHNPTETFVYEPSVPDHETILACLQWVINIETKTKCTFEHMRVVAYSWVRKALKHHYPVAGMYLQDIADYFDLTGEQFIDKYWDPQTPKCRTPPVLLSFAISCLYILELAVVDEKGERPDGLCRGPKWRIKLKDKRWQVWCRTQDLDFLTLSQLSPTIPFEVSSSTQDSEVIVQGGALTHVATTDFVAGGARQGATVLDKTLNPFLSGDWYARVLWRLQWVRAYNAGRLPHVVDNEPVIELVMTDDSDIVLFICTMLDQLFERLHSPVVLYYGQVQFFACNITKHSRLEIMWVPRWREAYIRLMTALQNLMRLLKVADEGRIHLFGIPFGGPVTCWARWASRALVLVDGVTHRIILLFRVAPMALHPEMTIQGGASSRMLSNSSLARSTRNRLRASARTERTVTLHVTKGKNIEMQYVGSVSSKQILKYFARAKRVGVEHLTLKVYSRGEWIHFHYKADGHVSWNWTGLTVIMENHRAATLATVGSTDIEHAECLQAQLNRAEMKKYGTPGELRIAEDHVEEAQQNLASVIDRRSSSRPRIVTANRSASSTDTRPQVLVPQTFDADDDEDEVALTNLRQVRDSLPTLERDVQIVSVRRPPQQCVPVFLSGLMRVPLAWTEVQIGRYLEGVYAVDRQHVGVRYERFGGVIRRVICVKNASLPCAVVQGGGRLQRVQQNTLEGIVISRLTQDMSQLSPDRPCVEHKLLEHLAKADAKFIRCAFQANSSFQRLAALSGALERAGLSDLSQRIGDLKDKKKKNETHTEYVQEPSAVPSTQSINSTIAATEKSEPFSPPVLDLDQRVRALELWAHSVDADPDGTGARQNPHMPMTVESDLRDMVMKVLNQERVQHSEMAVDQIIAVLPLCREGLMVEHDLVKEVLKKDVLAAEGVLKAATTEDKYKELGLALMRAGHDIIGKGLVNACVQKDQTPGEDAVALQDLVTTTELVLHGRETEDRSEMVKTDPYQPERAQKKRGRPPTRVKRISSPDQCRDGLTRLTQTQQMLEEQVLNRLMKLERQVEERAQGPASYSQPTIDYDLEATRCRQWEQKIDHMDSYLAELGAAHLQMREKITALADMVRNGLPDPRPATSTPRDDLGEQVLGLQRKLEAIECQSFGLGDMRASEDKVKFLETKLAVLQNDVVNSTRLLHFMWSCSQNVALRVQTLHDSTSMTLHQMAALRAAFGSS
eukprot:6492492-Amphidinium_carterae.1